MKKILKLFFLFLILNGCQSAPHPELNGLKTLEAQIDSVSIVYKSMPWDSLKSIQKEMILNNNFIAKNIELAGKIDNNFMSYYGPYTDATKMIGRIFKKRNPKIDREIARSKIQVSNLTHDIKNNFITNADSIKIYIKSESMAYKSVSEKISLVQQIMNQQFDAYNQTHAKVDSLVIRIMKK